MRCRSRDAKGVPRHLVDENDVRPLAPERDDARCSGGETPLARVSKVSQPHESTELATLLSEGVPTPEPRQALDTRVAVASVAQESLMTYPPSLMAGPDRSSSPTGHVRRFLTTPQILAAAAEWRIRNRPDVVVRLCRQVGRVP